MWSCPTSQPADRRPDRCATTATSYAVSLNLAQDRAHRDHEAADAWRRLHARPDVESAASVVANRRSIRSIVAGLVAGLHVRRARPTT